MALYGAKYNAIKLPPVTTSKYIVTSKESEVTQITIDYDNSRPYNVLRITLHEGKDKCIFSGDFGNDYLGVTNFMYKGATNTALIQQSITQSVLIAIHYKKELLRYSFDSQSKYYNTIKQVLDKYEFTPLERDMCEILELSVSDYLAKRVK